MSIVRKLVIILVCLPGGWAFGQGAASPFTTFGIGEPFGNSLIHNQGMAGVGIATPQYWYLNNQNPALLVYNTATMFSAGILYESRTLQADTTSEKNAGGNMNYLAMAFPIQPRDVTKPHRWTTSLGLMPFTNVAYNLVYEEEIGNTTGETAIVSQEGSGGLSQFYWSNGYRIRKGLSLGLRAAYIFGPISSTYSNTLVETNQLIRYRISVEEEITAHDFMFEGGIAYSLDSLFANGRYRFTIGGTYSFGTNLKADQQVVFSRSDLSAPDTYVDSLSLKRDNTQITIPEGIGFGISLANGQRWMAGVDFKYQDWSKFNGVEEEDNEGGTASWRLAFGAEYTPDLMSVDNIFQRITYRIGASMERCPFLVNNKQVNDFGINFGFSVPAGRSSLDLAFRMGKRGDRAENILEESYFKVYFGLTLNDRWFVKRKFD